MDIIVKLKASFITENPAGTFKGYAMLVFVDFIFEFERGEQWHTAAYSYRWDGKTFVINEEEAVAIRRIFEDFLKAVPLRHTSKWLEKHGYACSISFVRYVLQNPVYAGDVVLQRYFTENHRTHKVIKNEG